MSYPIILAHGVCRFDMVWSEVLDVDNSDDPKFDQLHYFKGLRTKLMLHGYAVYHSCVSWAAGVDTRAGELKRNVLRVLEKERAEKVNIIAHSMGGLDARHMLFNFRDSDRLPERIASLTTVSTPHEGSPFADWGTDNLPHVIPVARKLGLHLNGLADLRTDRCRRFSNDPAVKKFEKSCEEKIQFRTYAGRQNIWGVFDPLKLPYYIIEKEEGDNDGLVSVKSAKWREPYFKGILDHTDHLNELGWWDTAQVFAGESEGRLLERIHDFYLTVAGELP
ncbi:MAG: alpha/beta fold hydrolase [Desulfobacterales bacterium]